MSGVRSLATRHQQACARAHLLCRKVVRLETLHDGAPPELLPFLRTFELVAIHEARVAESHKLEEKLFVVPAARELRKRANEPAGYLAPLGACGEVVHRQLVLDVSRADDE